MAAVTEFVNRTLVCQDPHSSGHLNIWQSGNPLESPTCLFFLQVSLMTIATQLMDVCLKPLGQSSLVSQILGGLLFGPSALGHNKIIGRTLFPIKGDVVLKTISILGFMFYCFMWCVKLDLYTLLKTERLPRFLAMSVFLFTLIIPTGFSMLLKKFVAMKGSIAKSLPIIGFSQSITLFVSVAVLLADVKVLNTHLGRLTMSVAILSNLPALVLSVVTVVVIENLNGNIQTVMFTVLSVVVVLVVNMCVLRRFILWMLKYPDRGPTDENCVVWIFVSILFSALLSETVGLHTSLGPIILGMSLPEGPPLGTSLMIKLETICTAFLNPIFQGVNGLRTDIFIIDLNSIWIIGLILLVGFFVKIGAVMLPGYYFNLSMKECWTIGLLLNGRGISELLLYNMWLESRLLTKREFSLLVVTVIIVNIIIVPLIKFIYDPSEEYQTGRRHTIQHNRQDSALRVMVCIHDIENLPTILNLLEASYATRESMIEVTTLFLVELKGRARPILLSNEHHDSLNPVAGDLNHIDNALNQYARNHEGYVSIQSFTSISTLETMHDDICRISLECGANILILPFHKKWEIDGTVEVRHRSIQTLNINILKRAPCSVGILVDRSILGGSPSLFTVKGTYFVVMFFTGGADDEEALTYCSRMARHECVQVTVVRFLLFGEENSKDRKHDSDLINEYRYYNAGNKRFEIFDEVVKDGIEMFKTMRRLVDHFDLVMVGRQHPDGVLFQGQNIWSECRELGVIGDMLASPEFVTKASVLVVQQQKLRGKIVKSNVDLNPVPKIMDPLVVHNETFDPSFTILVDKYDKM